MEPARGSADEGGSNALRRWGPLAALAVVAAVIIGIVVAGSGDDDDPETSTDPTAAPVAPEGSDGGGEDTTAPTTEGPGDAEAILSDPEIPLSISDATELGIADQIDWGDRCDVERGTIAVPWFFAPECYRPYAGAGGGATAPGVTDDTIRIVWWQSAEQDLILQYITDAIVNDDTNADVEQTLQDIVDYYETFWETYGREIELIVFQGTGTINDEVSARADAVQIDEEYDPFMVWSGPSLTNAFAEELAARNIPCIGCGPTQPYDYYAENDPYSWTLGLGGVQANMIMAEFVDKQLAPFPVSFAGDESMNGQERVFGRLWITSSEESIRLNEAYEADLSARGIELAESVSYQLDPATIQESAATAIARFKEAGVTTLLLTGDPVGPRDITREATAQGYFPEWILAPTVLADTNVFARTYDQEQWANTIGVSTSSVEVSQEVDGAYYRYEWFYGQEPPADDTIGVLDPNPSLFFNVYQAIGPNLTAETWRDTLFAFAPTQTALSAPSLSWGTEGRWPSDMEPDYYGIDDVSVIWWDPEEFGLGETGNEGFGMWKYVNGGERWLFGDLPTDPLPIFDQSNGVALFDTPPPEEAYPAYPSPAGG
ncbi:MAG: hypothetical protein HKN26_15425 [Acidimicrobiales bacterium]|nr:hypothetical protein [Acidimicrobiales bacterium]